MLSLVTFLAFFLSSDSLTTITLSPATAYASFQRWHYPLSYNRAALYQTLEQGGLGIIRKGPDFALDIEWEGFKRYDLAVSIDGERQHNGCPNRMDAPIVKINPLEIAEVQITTSSSNLHTGLGGGVMARRRIPAESFSAGGYLRGGLLSSPLIDVGGAVEWKRQGLYARYYQAQPYLNGEGKSFADLYNYRTLPQWGYRVMDVSFQGKRGAWRYGALFRNFKDILFPYLMMDERSNQDIGGFVEYAGHHFYMSGIHHIMNSGLRRGMFMETDARVLTAGITGAAYEVYWRRWDAVNTMTMSNGITMEQPMMGRLDDIRASIRHTFTLGTFQVAGRLGVHHSRIGDTTRLHMLENIHTSSPASRTFIPFGLSVSYPGKVEAMMEASLEAPESEYLYITLKRPMSKPSWYGNPGLKPTLRLSARVGSEWQPYVRGQLFVHYLKNYVGLVAQSGMSPYYSYGNIDALMAGYHLQAQWKWFRLATTYTWGHNLTDNVPLAEVSPLKGVFRIASPFRKGVRAYVSLVGNAAQHRIDTLVGETATPGWVRLDAGVQYIKGSWRVEATLINATNANYYQHLSYIRNPFMMQRKVWEPGRSVTVGIYYVPSR